MEPVISICMSTFNHERYISQAIEGVLMQKTQFDFQLVIGDDCSTDDTRNICEHYATKYPDKIKLLPSDKKYGQCHNLTRILNACSGTYIALCEGDDFWTDPFKLQKQVAFLETHSDCVLCFHRVNTVDHKGSILHYESATDQVLFFEGKEFFHIPYPTLALVFRNCLPYFPEEFYKVKSTDAFLFGMLAGFGKGANLGFVGASYRMHEGGCYNQLATVNKYKQSLHTRKLMVKSSFFNKEQKEEIQRERRRRKILYSKIFLKKRELGNFIRIVLS